MLHPGYTPRLTPPRKASNGRSSSLLLQRVRPMQVARSWGQHKKTTHATPSNTLQLLVDPIFTTQKVTTAHYATIESAHWLRESH